MRTQTTVLTERGQISIPASIRKELNLKPGQALVWEKLSDRECLIRVPQKEKAPRRESHARLRRPFPGREGHVYG